MFVLNRFVEKPGLTFEVESPAALVFHPPEQQAEHGAPVYVLVPVTAVLVVQDHGVRLAPPGEPLSVLPAGEERLDGQVALLEPPEHEAGDGHVDGGLDVRRLVELSRSAVHHEQAVAPRLELLPEPLRALTDRHRLVELNGPELIKH